MPYSKSSLPPAAKHLKGKALTAFIATANAMLKDGVDEGEAIATGLAQAKKANTKKSTVKKSAKKDQMISYEVIYEPNVKDAQGNWASKEVLEKACANFNEYLKQGIVKSNLFHLEDTELFTIEDSWINKELDVMVEESGQPIKAGTWVCKLAYKDVDLWEAKKAGELEGVSFGAVAIVDESTGEILDIDFGLPLTIEE